MTIANVRANAKISATGVGAPNATTGISTEFLDVASIATNQATYPLKIVALSTTIGNDNTSAFNLVEVILNSTNYKSGVA